MTTWRRDGTEVGQSDEAVQQSLRRGWGQPSFPNRSIISRIILKMIRKKAQHNHRKALDKVIKAVANSQSTNHG